MQQQSSVNLHSPNQEKFKSASITMEFNIQPTVYRSSTTVSHDTSLFRSKMTDTVVVDCTHSTCDTCNTELQTACRWCEVDNRCGENPLTCSSGTAISVCPYITTVSPSNATTAGNKLITITGSNFIASSQLSVRLSSCSFSF